MPLEMKYFVLKPRAKTADDAFAKASQRAMSAYADSLEDDGVELELARELSLWSVNELLRQRNLTLATEPAHRELLEKVRPDLAEPGPEED